MREASCSSSSTTGPGIFAAVLLQQEKERDKDSVWRVCLFIPPFRLVPLGPGGTAQRINGWATVLSPDPMESWT